MNEPPQNDKPARSARGVAAQAATQLLPPHSIEAERGVLGCCLIDPARALPECEAQLPARAFYDLRHQEIYDLLMEMHGAGKAVDLLTVQAALTDRGRLEALGGLDYLVSLPEATPSAINLPTYTEIVREKCAQRRLITACSQVIEKVYDPEQTEPAAKLLEEAERLIGGIEQIRAEETLLDAKAACRKLSEVFDSYVRGVGIPGGLKTGLAYYDRMLGGFFPREYAVLAGRPGTGKTSLALNIIDHLCRIKGIPCALFSLEMTATDVMLRWCHQVARVNLQQFRTGYLEDRDFPKLTNTGIDMMKMPLWLDDRSGMTIHEIRSKARRLVREHGVKFIVIDYLQLIKSGDPRLNREQQVAEISAEILAMVKELSVPALVLAQLNRQSEASDRASHGPKLSDLRESGSVEQDAHNVTILWNYSPKEGTPEAERLEEWETRFNTGSSWSDKIGWVRARVCKNRSGPTGDCDLVFQRAHMNFLDPNDNK